MHGGKNIKKSLNGYINRDNTILGCSVAKKTRNAAVLFLCLIILIMKAEPSGVIQYNWITGLFQEPAAIDAYCFHALFRKKCSHTQQTRRTRNLRRIKIKDSWPRNYNNMCYGHHHFLHNVYPKCHVCSLLGPHTSIAMGQQLCGSCSLWCVFVCCIRGSASLSASQSQFGLSSAQGSHCHWPLIVPQFLPLLYHFHSFFSPFLFMTLMCSRLFYLSMPFSHKLFPPSKPISRHLNTLPLLPTL